MAAHHVSIPELDHRLEQHRGAAFDAALGVRRRLRRAALDLSLLRQARRHPVLVLAAAAGFGLLLGRLTARVLRRPALSSSAPR